MIKICDQKGAGMVICRDNKFVVIERRNYPESFALPAGHLDGDDHEGAALRETVEETGLIVSLASMLLKEEICNPCKREKGVRHYWSVFKAKDWFGELKAGSDTKTAVWMPIEELRRLMKRTEYFSRSKGIAWYDVGTLTKAIFGDPQNPQTDPEWKEQMGLEPVWYYILRKSLPEFM